MPSQNLERSQFVDFACSGCRGELRAVAAAADRLARCPECGGVTPIPAVEVEGETQGELATADKSISGGQPAPGEDGPTTAERPQPVFSRAFGYVPPAMPCLVAVGDIVGRTWDIFFHRFFEVLLVVLAVGLGTMVALAVGLSLDVLAFLLMLKIATPEAAILVAIVGFFPALLPAVWIQVGQVIYLLKLARGHKVKWHDLLRGGSYVVEYLHAAILIGLLTVVGLLLCFVPGMIVLAVLTPTWYLIVERELRPVAAMKAAWQLVRGNFVHILLVMAVHIGVTSLAELIPCGLGHLLATPFVALLWTVTYLRLTGQPTVTYEYGPSAG
jgi:hypothetical protein